MLQSETGCGAARVVDADNSRVLVLSENNSLEGRKPFLLDQLTPEERNYVIGRCTPKLAKRNSIVFRQGEVQKGIFLILSGGVRVFYTAPTGKEITRAYWFKGNFIGGPDVFARNRNMWSAVAVRDTSLLLLPSATLHALCARMPNLALGLIEAMVFKGRCYAAMTQMLGTRTAAERLSRVLILLAEMYGTTTADGVVIDAPVTHDEISHMVGATRQWVTIGLNRLQSDGLVVLRRRQLLIKDLKRLSELVSDGA